METVNNVLLAATVHLVRQVPWGPSRDDLEHQAEAFGTEAGFESGWDNYSTSAALSWRSRLFNLAAQARFPRSGDELVASMKKQLLEALIDEVCVKEVDYDVGEWTSMVRSSLSSAIKAGMQEIKIDAIIDELANNAHITDDPEELKLLHKNPDMVSERRYGALAL